MNIVNYLSKDLLSKVELNKRIGTLSITGKLISLYPTDSWLKVNRWLEENTVNPIKKLTIQLDCINSGNVVELVTFIRKMNNRMNSNIEINWEYDSENEDMKELGEDIHAITKVPFVLNSIGNYSTNRIESYA